MNKQDIYNAHEMLNDYFFKGYLSTPKIYLYNCCVMGNDYKAYECDNVPDEIDTEKLEVLFGYYEMDYNIIGLTKSVEILHTLAHEMIHQYQTEFFINENDHGREFKRMARYIETVLNIKKGTI